MATDSIFMGNSRYSSDFSAVLDRSLAIASLPLAQMQQAAQRTSNESSALSAIDLKFTALDSALKNLEAAGGAASYSASVSQAEVVSASVSAGALEGSYFIEVTSLGASTNTLSVAPGGTATRVTEPATENIAAGPFTLTLNSDTPISLTASNLTQLVAQINEKAGTSLQASIVNVGSPSAPDYRLSVQSRKLRADVIQLKAGDGTDLLSQLTAGKPVTYKINGAPEQTSETRSLTLSPGLTITIKGKSEPGVQTSITVTRTANPLRTALSEFANAYNGALDELDKHRGEGSGVLTGNTTIPSLGDALRSLASYTPGTGTLSSLAMSGVILDDKGRMSIDANLFNAATASGLNDLLGLLGSAAGGGFLKFATGQLKGVSGDTTSYLKSAIARTNESSAQQSDRIEQEQERLDRLRESLQAQLSAADALIASLEQQATYINSMFEAMRMANEQ